MKNLKCVLLVLCIGMLFAACKKECVHQYQSEITLQANCAQEGTERFTCLFCGNSYTQPVPTTEHSYRPTKVEKEATCAEEGLQQYSCEICGVTNSEKTEKLPHTLENITVTKEPNCTDEGECTGDCTVCYAKQVTQKMTTNDVHVFTSTVVQEAMCTVAGEKQLVCSGCGKTVKETIAATGHKWAGGTCKKAGVCSKCGVTGEKTDHAYVIVKSRSASKTFAGYHMKKCSTCSKEKKEYYSASYVYDLEEMGAKIAAYARERGFRTCVEKVSNPDYSYSDGVWNLDRFSSGPDGIIEGGKHRIDNAYNQYASTPAGIGAYTAHIFVYYTENVSFGGGYFGVSIDITS